MSQEDGQKAAEKQRQAEAQDPLNIIQREELAIKKQDVAQKPQIAQVKAQADVAKAKMAEDTKRLKIANDARVKDGELANESEWVDLEAQKYEDGEDKRDTELQLMLAQIAEIQAKIEQMMKPAPRPSGK